MPQNSSLQPKPSTSISRPRASPQVSLKHSIEYLTNRHIVIEQEVYRQLEALRVQQQANHTQVLDLLCDLILHVSSSSSSSHPPSLSLSPPTATPYHSIFNASPLPTTPTLVPFLAISSPATSILSLTLPTSLVTPLPPPGLLLSAPIPCSLPISSQPPSYATPPQLRANLERSPFIGILPGASTEIFLTPHPLRALYPSPIPSPFVFPTVLSTPLGQTVLNPPLSTLPPLSLSGPSPSHIPHPSHLSFTFRQISSPYPSLDPLFSTFPTTTPFSLDLAL